MWWSAGYAINAYGDVTGASGDFSSFAAFLYKPSSGPTYLGTLGDSSFSLGTAINASDEVTGWSTIYPGVGCDLNPPFDPPYCDSYHAFLYTSSGGMQDLQTLGGSLSEGVAINASGEVVGDSTLQGDTVIHAFLYSRGVMKDLGTLDGHGWSYAYGINDSGDVVGISNGRPFLYSNGKMAELKFPGVPVTINNFGQIAGGGFLYSGGKTTALGWLDGQGINNFGQVVGNSGAVSKTLGELIGQLENHPLGYQVGPFLYTTDSDIVDVSSLLVPACDAEYGCVSWDKLIHNGEGINDAGQIAGEAIQVSTGNPAAFVFSPVTRTISPFQAKLQITGKGETHFHLTGSFTLGSDSNGLDPLTQNVLLQLGSLPVPIQKGLFKASVERGIRLPGCSRRSRCGFSH